MSGALAFDQALTFACFVVLLSICWVVMAAVYADTEPEQPHHEPHPPRPLP